jgi:lysophosphatidylglycerol acyltransferase 1
LYRLCNCIHNSASVCKPCTHFSLSFIVVELGDDIRTCLEDRTLVIANHQSTADVPLLMATFNTKKNVLPNLTWIMDRVFKYTNFGIVSILHEDFFIVSVSRVLYLFSE